MLLTLFRILLICGSLASLNACATPATPARMAPHSAAIPNVPLESRLRSAIVLSKVGGGEKTNPWTFSKVGDEELREALHLALDQYGYLCKSEKNAPYGLEVYLIELKQPESGLTMIVDSHIRYKLVSLADNTVAYDDVVTASYTATLDDAFMAPTRSKMATEGSIRINITNFLLRLQTLTIAEPAAK